MDMYGWLAFVLVVVVYILLVILAIILCPIVIPESSVLRYHAMHFSYLVGASCLTILSMVLFKIFPSDRCQKLVQWLSLFWIELMGWDLRTWRGLEVLVESDNAVIVVNHQSFYDVFPFLPVWNQLFPYVVTFAGSELKEYFLLGKGIQQLKSIHYLNRKTPREAMMTLLTDSVAHFKENKKNKIIILPEGTRNLTIRQRGWKLLDFKSGAFRVAKECNVPVIPVVLSPFYFIDQQRHYFTRGKTIASVMEPIYPSDEGVEEFRDKVKTLMQDEFFRLLDEVSGRSKQVVSPQNGKIQHD